MKKLLVLFLIITGAASIKAQDSLKFNDLVAPENPGFQILGISPQNIFRPGDTKALGTYFLNNVDDGSGLIKDVAVEVTPYWLTKRPDLSFKEYFGLVPSKSKNRFFEDVKQTFVLSLATTDYESTTDSITGRSWGFGFRTMLLRGTPRVAERIQLLEQLRQQDFVSEIYSDVVEELEEGNLNNRQAVLEVFSSKFDIYVNNPNLVVNFEKEQVEYLKSATLEYLRENLPNSIPEITSFVEEKEENTGDAIIVKIREESLVRKGLQVQLSGASSINIPNNDFEAVRGGNYGLWLTVSHPISKKGDLQFAGLARYLGSFENIGATNTDIGFSLSQTKKNYSLSGEFIYRSFEEEFSTFDISGQSITAINKDNSYRFTANLQVKITGDTNLNFSAGKDFDSKITTDSNIIALVGVNFDLFRNQFLKF